jgi:hypothetical protein
MSVIQAVVRSKHWETLDIILVFEELSCAHVCVFVCREWIKLFAFFLLGVGRG